MHCTRCGRQRLALDFFSKPCGSCGAKAGKLTRTPRVVFEHRHLLDHDTLLEEALEFTFPASDPISMQQPVIAGCRAVQPPGVTHGTQTKIEASASYRFEPASQKATLVACIRTQAAAAETGFILIVVGWG